MVSTISGDPGKEGSAACGWNSRPVPLRQGRLNRPLGIAASAAAASGYSGGGRVLFVADAGNNCLRRIDLDKDELSTLESGGDHPSRLELAVPMGVALDPGNCIYVSEWGSHRIARISGDGAVVAVAGGGSRGVKDGCGSSEARLFHPCGLAFDAGRGVLYAADFGNHCIRRITAAGDVTSIGRSGVVIVDDGRRYVSSSLGCIDSEDASQACFNSPQGVAVDSAGDVWVADWGNHAVRKIERV